MQCHLDFVGFQLLFDTCTISLCHATFKKSRGSWKLEAQIAVLANLVQFHAMNALGFLWFHKKMKHERLLWNILAYYYRYEKTQKGKIELTQS